MHAHVAPPTGFLKIPLKFGPYSASKLIAARCPARFESKYIKKDRIIADRLAAARGSAIHAVLEQISKARIEAREITPVELDRWITDSVGKNPAAYEQIQLIKEAATAYVRMPSAYLSSKSLCEQGFAVALYEEETFMDDAVVQKAFVSVPYVDPYQEAKQETPESLKAFFCCKIDQLSFDEINKTITIVDHKSTPSASENPDFNFQVGCYAWMVSLFYPGYRIRTVIHYAHPSLSFYSSPNQWSEEDIADIQSEVLMRIRAVESFAEYPALPGGHCDYCHMVTNCPEFRALEKQNASHEVNLNINTVDDMVKVARTLRVVGVVYDRLNKQLKDSIERLCPTSGIAIEGMWYGWRVSDSVDWFATDRKIREDVKKAEVALAADPNHPDAETFRLLIAVKDLDGLLERFGVNSGQLKNWGSDKMKGLWKLEKPGLIETLRKFAVLEKNTRFGGYKT